MHDDFHHKTWQLSSAALACLGAQEYQVVCVTLLRRSNIVILTHSSTPRLSRWSTDLLVQMPLGRRLSTLTRCILGCNEYVRVASKLLSPNDSLVGLLLWLLVGVLVCQSSDTSGQHHHQHIPELERVTAERSLGVGRVWLEGNGRLLRARH